MHLPPQPRTRPRRTPQWPLRPPGSPTRHRGRTARQPVSRPHTPPCDTREPSSNGNCQPGHPGNTHSPAPAPAPAAARPTRTMRQKRSALLAARLPGFNWLCAANVAAAINADDPGWPGQVVRAPGRDNGLAHAGGAQVGGAVTTERAEPVGVADRGYVRLAYARTPNREVECLPQREMVLRVGGQDGQFDLAENRAIAARLTGAGNIGGKAPSAAAAAASTGRADPAVQRRGRTSPAGRRRSAQPGAAGHGFHLVRTGPVTRHRGRRPAQPGLSSSRSCPFTAGSVGPGPPNRWPSAGRLRSHPRLFLQSR